MELKYNSIRKAQDEIVVEMNRAAKKKESIQIKYAKKPELERPPKDPENSIQLKKVMKVAKDNYAKIVKNVQDVEKNLTGKQQ